MEIEKGSGEDRRKRERKMQDDRHELLAWPHLDSSCLLSRPTSSSSLASAHDSYTSRLPTQAACVSVADISNTFATHTFAPLDFGLSSRLFHISFDCEGDCLSPRYAPKMQAEDEKHAA